MAQNLLNIPDALGANTDPRRGRLLSVQQPSAPSGGLTPPPLSQPAGGAQPTSLGTPAAPETPIPSQPSRPLLSLPSEAQMNYSRLASSPPGVQQVHNPIGRALLTAADAIGSGFFPNVAAFVPGTSAHHMLLTGEAGRALQRENQTRQSEASAGAENARADEERAQAEAIRTAVPAPVKHETLSTAEGIMDRDPVTGDVKPLTINGQPLHDPTKQQSENSTERDIEEFLKNNPGKTRLDAEKALAEAKNVKPRAKETPEEAAIAAHMKANPGETAEQAYLHVRKEGEKAPVVNVNAAQNTLDRETENLAKPYRAQVQGAAAQLDKIADAREMIKGNAESQALGIPKVLTALVSGQGTGVRITTPELNSIAKARGVQGDVEGWLRRVEGKGQLTPEQQKQLIGVLDDVEARIREKVGGLNGAIDSITSAKSREDAVKAESDYRKKIGEAQGATVPEVKTQQQFDALPSGAVYMEDGKKYRKP